MDNRINDKDRNLEITKEGKKRMKKSEEILYDPWDSIRRANTRIIGHPEMRRRKKFIQRNNS